jgi:CO dehydrogenase maturation factor
MSKILICGKGGSGKSTLAVLLARALRGQGRRVLLLDADESNHGLHRLLGVDPPLPLLDHLGGKAGMRQKSAPPFPGAPAQALFPASLRTADLPEDCLAGGDGMRLAVVGKIEHFAEGCACPMGALARQFLGSLQLEADEVLLVDTAAGVEHFGRSIDGLCDRVLAVVDPTYQSFDLLQRIRALAAEAERPLAVVLNKAEGETADLMRRQLGRTPVVAAVPNDARLFADSLAGRPFGNAPAEIEVICNHLLKEAL